MTTHLIVSRRHPAPLASLVWGDFDRLFDPLWRGLGASVRAAAAHAPRVDLSETETELRVAAELPGLEEKDIEVTLDDGVLTIRGERAAEESAEKSGLRHVESFRGTFQRSLRLPSEVDAEAVKAVYRNGVLTVTLPKAPEPPVRSIPVTTA